ncbi:MAG: biopolymer transporter ExbD [Planctomycetes bacterium]|nr:biopolymer transporter ExbD [Planctomycetota bacterium]
MKIRRPGAAGRMQPPMTPMIDAVFQLLIFFLLTPAFSLTEGFLTTNLPTTSGPVAGKEQKLVQRIKIELYNVGQSGEFEDGGKNEFVSIVFNETQNLGANFDALRAALEEKRAQGLAANTPVLISPTMGCRHKWVVRAFDAAVASRFTEIQFAVPYQ